MSISILTPDNSFNFTCADKTCGAVFPAPKPIPEVINATAMLPIILIHQQIISCPRCGASYRALIKQAQIEYVFQRLDVDLVPPANNLVQFPGH